MWFIVCLCVNAWLWMTATFYFPWKHEGKNKDAWIRATIWRGHRVSLWLCARPLPVGLSWSSVAVTSSLVTVPSCCSVPGLDNKSTLNEALMPRGFTERTVMLSACVCLFLSPLSQWGGTVGLYWREHACAELMCVYFCVAVGVWVVCVHPCVCYRNLSPVSPKFQFYWKFGTFVTQYTRLSMPAWTKLWGSVLTPLPVHIFCVL